MFSEFDSIRVNLDCEFTCRSHDQSARFGLLRGCGLTLEQARVKSDKERRGFPRSGLRLPGHIVARKRDGQRLALDRRAVCKARVGDSLEQVRRYIECRELELCEMALRA